MNVKEYIENGTLESYALGELTAFERADVEQALLKYPELREELKKIEKTMEKVYFASAVAPRPDVKSKMLESLSPNGEKMIPLEGTVTWKYAAAASIVVALSASFMAFYYRQQWKETSLALNEIISQNQHMASDYNIVNQKLDKIQNDFSVLTSSAFTKVVMRGTLNDKNALASVYWNSSTREVYLSIQQLKAIAKENQFQLWAIVDGKPVDVGVFDMDFSGLLKMKSIAKAAAFAVTVEPKGGSENPTLGNMQVIGSVVINPS